MTKYPINLNLDGRRAVVIGAGPIASRKVRPLVEAGSKVTVVAKRVDNAFRLVVADLDIEIIEDSYRKEHLAGTRIVIAATDDNELNKQIYADCQAEKVLCNVVDVPELCDFYVPAIVLRGDLQIAIGTNGKCPAYSGRVRRMLEEMFTQDHANFLDELGKVREKVVASDLTASQRKEKMAKLCGDESFELFVEKGVEAWREFAD